MSYISRSTNKNIESMSSVSEEGMGIYLYVSFPSGDKNEAKNFLAVTKANLYSQAAINLESVGEHSILFTSILPYEEIKSKFSSNKIPFLLLNLGILYDLECICGFLPESELKTIQNITTQKFSKNKLRLKRLLQESIEKEKFELAAKLRDIK